MNLLEFINEKERAIKLAADTGKSRAYLYQVATGWQGKRCSPELAQAIEEATTGEIKCGSEPCMRDDLQWVRGADGKITGHFVPAQQSAA